MLRGSAHWTYDPEAKVWYFGLSERVVSPNLRQIMVEAVLDLDSDGRLAGIFINGAPIEPPLNLAGKD